MNFNSLRAKITLIFIFALILFLTTFIFYLEYEKKQVHLQASSYHENIAKSLRKMHLPPPKMIEYLKDFQFELERSVHTILPHGEIVFSKPMFQTILYQDNYYFHFRLPFRMILFKDLKKYKKNYYGDVVFTVVFFIIFFLYIWLMRSLKPLHELKQEIAKFVENDFTIPCKSDKKDEIAEVANEFHCATQKIKLILDSRQLFLRTIMHELKTPIAKGRLVSELIDDTKQKNRIIIIFEKLNQLIDEFAKIEQIISHNYQPSMYESSIRDIINKAIDILMIDSKEYIILKDISNQKIYVDLGLISFALKNLIDNGLKYSKDTKVIIKEEKNQLLILSKGDKLTKPLEEYYKPLHNETASKNHGMGLGLYIVHSILKMHSMQFEYEYREKHNIFKIIY